MPFLKRATIGAVSGVAVGAVFYTLGGVANVIFPTVTGIALGVIGFSSALAIALLEDIKEEK